MKSNLPESSKGQTLRRRIDTIIALLFLTVLVGSLVVVVNLMHHGTNHTASPSSRLVPTLSVYVGNGTGGLEKLDASTGRLIWTFQTQGKEVPAPALIANNTAYFGSTDGNLYAVNATTGKQKWQFSTGQAILGSPILANGVLYFGSDDGNLYAVNPSSGAKMWSRYAGTGGEAVSVGTPAVVNGVVYATSTNNSTHSYVLAVKAKTGAQIWRQMANSELLSSPQVSGNKVYVAATAITKPGQSSTRESHLEVFNAADGSHAVQLAHTQFATASTQSISPPTLANGSIYTGSLNGSVSATGANGNALWQRSLGGEVDASPQLANGSLFVGVNVGTIKGNSIVALNAANGAVRWQRFIDNYGGGNIVVSNTTVFFGTVDGHVYALDANTGAVRWTVQDSASFSNQPLSVGP
jgi:eukaryotic-like serine/threonine-protein kinase